MSIEEPGSGNGTITYPGALRWDPWQHPYSALPLPLLSGLNSVVSPLELTPPLPRLSQLSPTASPAGITLSVWLSPILQSMLSPAILNRTCLKTLNGFPGHQDQVQIPCPAVRSLYPACLLPLPFLALDRHAVPQSGCGLSFAFTPVVPSALG